MWLDVHAYTCVQKFMYVCVLQCVDRGWYLESSLIAVPHKSFRQSLSVQPRNWYGLCCWLYHPSILLSEAEIISKVLIFTWHLRMSTDLNCRPLACQSTYLLNPELKSKCKKEKNRRMKKGRKKRRKQASKQKVHPVIWANFQTIFYCKCQY